MDLEQVMYESFVDELRKIAASRQQMAVSQTRKGRRPMRVDTMLKKDKEGTLFKKAGLMDVLKTPIPNTKDWFINTTKSGLQGASKLTRRPLPQARSATRTLGGVTSIGDDELRRLGFGDLAKRASLMDVLTTPIPGTKDWFIRTGKQGLGQVASAMKKPMRPMGGTRTAGGVTSIGADELKRLGFGDLSKRASMELQGSLSFQGLPIGIEQKKGSTREGVDADGKAWKTTFKIPYGYIKGTKGNDGEEIDAFVGPNKKSTKVFVVHQRKLKSDRFDEDKVMFGFNSEDEARQAYLDNYNENGPKLLGPITEMTLADLKTRLDEKSEHKKLAWAGTGSSTAPSGYQLPSIDLDEHPDRRYPGDVPSRDGTNPGAVKVEKYEEGQGNMTTLPTNAAMGGSSSGAARFG